MIRPKFSHLTDMMALQYESLLDTLYNFVLEKVGTAYWIR